ncbi:transposase [Parapedobacter lycopersici]|uniref:transposase n=1 Tax=Parapedobacter lycopersici TaxID=1864939 RepID=UPI00214DB187|nr:transposase [Parapedobacter lycopersici]
MNDISANYLTRAEIWLCVTTLAYFFMNGAQLFETATLVPKWSAAPPESLHYFRGKFGLDLKTFWIVIHSLHEITFIMAIIFCWKLDIRYPLLLLFAIHMAVRIWTLAYFAPNIMAFRKIANLGTVPDGMDLLSRATWWRNLNYIRVAIFVAVSLGLVPLCIKLLNMRTG